jgi:glycosyltransferase involved in cell wall biosynthesis
MCRTNTPVEYLPSWAEDLFRIEDGNKQIDMRANDQPFTLLFAGNIGDAQDFPCILAAAEILREYEHIQWLVCGDGRMRQWVAKEIERRNLTRHVKLLGQLPLESMPALYRQADALLVTLKDVPLFRMTVPGKLQSYFAAGKPILAALGGEGADLIRSSGSGLVSSPGDASGLAKATLEISRLTTSERVKMGEKGRQLYELEFQRGVVMNRLERKLLGVGQGSAKRHRIV